MGATQEPLGPRPGGSCVLRCGASEEAGVATRSGGTRVRRAAGLVVVCVVLAAAFAGPPAGSTARGTDDGEPAALPAPVSSPPIDPAAPYTPLVRSLIDQLLPDDPPTLAQLRNAGRLFEGRDTRQGGDAGIGSCHTVGRV